MTHLRVVIYGFDIRNWNPAVKRIRIAFPLKLFHNCEYLFHFYSLSTVHSYDFFYALHTLHTLHIEIVTNSFLDRNNIGGDRIRKSSSRSRKVSTVRKISAYIVPFNTGMVEHYSEDEGTTGKYNTRREKHIRKLINSLVPSCQHFKTD